MKYKVGDRVKYGSEICTVTKVLESQGKFQYRVESDTWFDIVNEDEMIECKVEDTITTNEQLNEQMFVPSNISLEKEMEWNLPEGYIFKDENGNVINAMKIVLEKKKKDVNLTQEQINKMVHESCILFCKHSGCGVPRETCTSLGTCKEHDEYRAAIRTHLMEKKKKEYPKTYEECCNMEKITILANRLAESILMDWDKEEQIKLAKEVACKCHKYFNEK